VAPVEGNRMCTSAIGPFENLTPKPAARFITGLIIACAILVLSDVAQASAFKVGSFTKSTGAAPASQTVAHGLGTTPKVIIFWTNGKTNESFSSSFLFGFGAMDGTTSKSVGASSQDAVSTSNASRRVANKALTIIQWGETVLAECDFTSWNSTNFVINWTTNNATAYVIHFIAIGGSDVSAKVIGWQMVTATGNQSVTGVGFRPNVVIHSYANSGFVTAPSSDDVNAGFGLGVMDANGDQWVSDIFSVDASGTSDTQRGQLTNSCVFAFDNALGVTKQASWVSMDTDGFTVNFSTANAKTTQAFSIALKGVNVKPGSFNKSTAAATATQNITGVGFKPSLVMLTSFQDVAQANAVVHTRFGFGASDGTTQGSSAFQDTDNLGTTSVDGIDKTSKVFMKVNNNTPAIDAEANLSSLNTDGFTLSWTTNDAVATQILFLAIGPLAPTAADVTAIEATRYDNGVWLKWKTGYEVNNLGFNITRERNGMRTHLNPSLIAGSALTTGEGIRTSRSYEWWDDLPRDGQAPAYWIEDVDLNGERVLRGPIIPVDQSGNARGAKRAKLLSRVGRDSIENGFPVQLEQRLEAATTPGVSITTQWDIAARSAVKLSVRKEGWYRVGQPQLMAAGLESGVDPRKLQLFLNGIQQPIIVFGEQDGKFDAADYIEFYGTGIDTLATDTQVYWLVKGSTAGARIKQTKATGSQSAGAASFPYTIEFKERFIYFSALRNGDADNFFGGIVSSDPLDQPLTVQHLDTGSLTPAALQVSLQGVNDIPDQNPDHRITLKLNGVDVGQFSFDGRSLGNVTIPIQPGLLREGANIVNITATNGPDDVSLVNFIRLTYSHTYNADSNALVLTTQDKSATRVGGFSNSRIRVIDITAPDQPQEILGTVSQSSAFYSVTFSPQDFGQRRFLAFSEDRIETPVDVKANRPSSLHSSGNFADEIIIVHSNFASSIGSLKSLRESQGLSVMAADVEDVYDEFGYGSKGSQAIKDFLQLASTTWLKKPRFVLLVGDATFDPRNYLALGAFDFVPTKLINTNILETASDDWLADFDNDGIPELAIGRLPVRTLTEASRIISKITNYDLNKPVGSWQNEIMLATDRDLGFSFTDEAASIQAQIPSPFNVSSVLRSQLDVPTARSQILSGITNGKLIVHYFGHGSVERWGTEPLLTTDDANALTNGSRLPFFVIMDCLNGFYQDVFTQCLGETLMKSPNGGAVAVWTSSGLCEADPQVVMDQEMFRLLFGAQPMTIGEAAMNAKRVISDMDVRRTWILMGDPAMRIR